MQPGTRTDLQRGNGWTAEQLALMKWLILPEQLRQPSTITALAIELDVSRETIYTWQKHPDWTKAMREMSIVVLLEVMPAIANKMISNMIGNHTTSARDREIYFRYVVPNAQYAIADGHVKEVLAPATSASSDNPQKKYELALQEVQHLPQEQQSTILRILQDLKALPPAEDSTAAEAKQPFSPYKFHREDKEEDAGRASSKEQSIQQPVSSQRKIVLLHPSEQVPE